MSKTCPYCAEQIQDEAIKCKHCQTWLDPAAQPFLGSPSRPTGSGRLRRSSSDCVLMGVCGGIGRMIGVDPVLVRVVYAILTFFTLGLPGIILYGILALVIPSDADTGGLYP